MRRVAVGGGEQRHVVRQRHRQQRPAAPAAARRSDATSSCAVAHGADDGRTAGVRVEDGGGGVSTLTLVRAASAREPQPPVVRARGDEVRDATQPPGAT